MGRGAGRRAPPNWSLPSSSTLRISITRKPEQLLLEQFEALHPGVILSASAYSDSPLSYLRADTPPDVLVMWSGGWLADGIREELLTDLTDVSVPIEADMPYETQLQEQAQRDGGRYLAPIGYHWRGIYYNVELFDELGLTPPQTWAELQTIADTLQSNGVVPFALPAGNPWTASVWFDYLNMRLNGPEFHQSLIRGEVAYSDERVRNVFQTWLGLLEAGYFTSDLGISDGFSSAAALVRGDGDTALTQEKAAMTLLAPFDFEDLPALFQGELGVFPFPPMDPALPRGEVINAMGYAVPAGAANRPQALEFVRYITSSEAQVDITQLMSGEANFVPVDTTNLNDLPASVQQGLAVIEQADVVVLPSFWASPPSMTGPLINEMERFLRDARRGSANVDRAACYAGRSAAQRPGGR